MMLDEQYVTRRWWKIEGFDVRRSGRAGWVITAGGPPVMTVRTLRKARTWITDYLAEVTR